jgi:hypothetical protein
MTLSSLAGLMLCLYSNQLQVYKYLKFTKSSQICNCTVHIKTLIYRYNIHQHSWQHQLDMPSVKPAFLNKNVNYPTLHVYKADKGINNEGNELSSTNRSGFVDGNLCPLLLYLKNGMTNVKKKELNFRLHIPLSIVN